MTPFLLILFHFLGSEFIGVFQERLIDTGIGCVVALMAGYLLFPNWEAEGLNSYMQNMLQANAAYLEKILNVLGGNKISLTEYKLTRKEVYISSGNLAAAFQRMLSEPKGKQKNKNEIHQFVVLNHTLFSNLASIASGIIKRAPRKHPDPIIRTARKALYTLQQTAQSMGAEAPNELIRIHDHEKEEYAEIISEEVMIQEQLEFINKLTADIKKTTEKITS